MQILGLIPARGGSKGIPGKNKKILGEIPLINYTIHSGLSCNLINRLIVSTDDNEIMEISENAGAEVPFIRPAGLAEDTSPTIDTVIHAIQFFEEHSVFFDAVCLLQPTVPFRSNEDLENAIQKFIASGADSLISVREVPHVYNPNWVFEENHETGLLNFPKNKSEIITRRQDLPKAYYRDGSVYITRKEVILKQRSLYGKTISHYEMQNAPNINIDTIDDWEAALDHINSN